MTTCNGAVTIKARTFNSAGLARFDEWLDEANRAGRFVDRLPVELLLDDYLTEDAGFEFPAQQFELKYDMGKCLLEAMGSDAESLFKDDGLWPWLSLALHESTMPQTERGFRVGHRSRHRIQRLEHRPNQSQAHRHLVYAAVFNVWRFGGAARVLMQKPCEHSRVEEDVMSRRTSSGRRVPLAGAVGVVGLLNKLYGEKPANIEKGKEKSRRRGRGVGKGSGEFLRFLRWLEQIKLTYDVVALKSDQLESILPAEFAERLDA